MEPKNIKLKIILPALLLLVCITGVCLTLFFMQRSQKADNITDYTESANWAYWNVGSREADLFLVCPTVDMGLAGNFNLSMQDEKTKADFLGALNMERGIYEDEASLYAPYYRQATFPVYSMTADEAAGYFSIAYEDVRAAFLYYMDHSPKDRPLLLAGFSQGSDMVLRLLKEFFDNPDYQDRLIAAYCIGWRITDQDLAECPWLKMAETADDTGVIISFNTEAVNVSESLLVPAGIRTHAINPLNWKTDDTPAAASENLGACFTTYSGEIREEIPALTGAYLDPARGTLKAPDINPADYSNSLFPDGVYHLDDYQFFYRNLQQNVAQRVEAYFMRNTDNKAA